MRITKKAVAVIAALEDIKGRLTPQQVVKEATDKRSPLHPYFEWNDTKAAKLHRIEQARDLIKRVKIVVTISEHKIHTLAYVRDSDMGPVKPGYISLLKIGKRQSREVMAQEIERIIELVDRAIKMTFVTEGDLPRGIRSKLISIRKNVKGIQKTL